MNRNMNRQDLQDQINELTRKIVRLSIEREGLQKQIEELEGRA